MKVLQNITKLKARLILKHIFHKVEILFSGSAPLLSGNCIW